MVQDIYIIRAGDEFGAVVIPETSVIDDRQVFFQMEFGLR